MHLDLSAPKDSVADWVGSGEPLHQGDIISLITFKDGTSTILHNECGGSAIRFGLEECEREAREQVIGHITREAMETAGIYEEYKTTFGETVSVRIGALDPTGQFYPIMEGDDEFRFDRDTNTNETLITDFRQFIGSLTLDSVAESRATAWEEEWEALQPSESEYDSSEYDSSEHERGRE
ncbi:hypothetical protein L198_07015 [Cryptococcus wingfieldii CBS 7118]|uniref:Uncharacterized protein n=1 Tax=Cryptococcus wingfieldii CBS 7118 TaxID=1295528 RepID=A0A1E3II24_9TREE|nr:hypothetical protein L198_07015 [Cryptococcus wingfieldii CBS 7118]ODN87391.1 hypothetical protein L198_07015 [Cryptococcus wingfieldii CBS 7118]